MQDRIYPFVLVEPLVMQLVHICNRGGSTKTTVVLNKRIGGLYITKLWSYINGGLIVRLSRTRRGRRGRRVDSRRGIQGRPSIAEAPTIGKIHPFSKIGGTLEPVSPFWMPFKI